MSESIRLLTRNGKSWNAKMQNYLNQDMGTLASCKAKMFLFTEDRTATKSFHNESIWILWTWRIVKLVSSESSYWTTKKFLLEIHVLAFYGKMN